MIDPALKTTLAPPQSSKGSIDKAALKEACAQFESLLMQYLLKGMRRTVAETSFLKGGFGEKVWRDMFDQALAEEAGRAGGIGLGEMIYRQLLGLSEGQTEPARRDLTVEAYGGGRSSIESRGQEDLIMPVSGEISSPYGMREHPILGGVRMHHGVDIAAEPGTPIKAVAAGRVVFAGWREGYGYVVEIDHGHGVSTLYGHNQENLVKSGQEIKQGQTIAQVGQTGLSTGPHLHFEVRKDGHSFDPLAWLKDVSTAGQDQERG